MGHCFPKRRSGEIDVFDLAILETFELIYFQRMPSQAVDTVRLHVTSAMSDRKRRGLMRSRRLLLERHASLNELERMNLEACLNEQPLLKEAHWLKEEFLGSTRRPTGRWPCDALRCLESAPPEAPQAVLATPPDRDGQLAGGDLRLLRPLLHKRHHRGPEWPD